MFSWHCYTTDTGVGHLTSSSHVASCAHWTLRMFPWFNERTFCLICLNVFKNSFHLKFLISVVVEYMCVHCACVWCYCWLCSFTSWFSEIVCWQNSVKQASRAQILDKATEYIQYMRRKNHTHQQDIDDLKKQNALLEQQGEFRPELEWNPLPTLVLFDGRWVCRGALPAVRALEKAKGNTQHQTNYSSDSSLYTNRKGSAVSAFDGGSDSSSDSEPDEPPNRKRLRVEPS